MRVDELLQKPIDEARKKEIKNPVDHIDVDVPNEFTN